MPRRPRGSRRHRVPVPAESSPFVSGGSPTGLQRSIKTMGVIVAAVFAIILSIHAGAGWVLWSLHRFYEATARDVASYDETREEALGDRMGTFDLLQSGALFVGAAALLPWFFRAIGNIRRSRFSHSIDTPGWAIGAFLVPILGLWKPATLMTDLATLSGRLATEDGGPRPVVANAAMVWLWWGSFMGSNLLNAIAESKFKRAAAVEDLISAARFATLSSAAAVVAAATLILLVVRITALQERVRLGSDLHGTFG